MNDHRNGEPAAAPIVQSSRPRSATLSLIAKSLFATILLSGAMAIASYTLSNGIGQHGDDVSSSELQARLAAFRALKPLALSQVSTKDIDPAVQGMQLSSTATVKLKEDLLKTSSIAPSPPTLSPQNIPDTRQQVPQAVPTQAQALRLGLVWITLWDTDVEDGDVVRIESQGYSRTVRLTKKGDTFAIPVPASGVVNITGISDGDGGGITVGLASGGAKAIFPIMSEGQMLGLRVKVN